MAALRTKALAVREVDPRAIDFNLDNPRGELPDEIQADPDYVRLRESVSRYGVMVPLVGVQIQERPPRFRLIDGERRLRAALSVNAEKVPLHVIPEDDVDALVQSVHIHVLRKQWEEIARVRVVRRLIKRLRDSDPHAVDDEDRLRETVGELTGLGGQDLRRFVRVGLRYLEKDLRAVEKNEIGISYFYEIEERFVDQVDRVFPKLLKGIGERLVRRVMVEKAVRGALGHTHGLRPLGKLIRSTQHDRAKRTYMEALLVSFLQTPDMSADHVVETFLEKFPAETVGDDLLAFAETVKATAQEMDGALKGLDLRELRANYPAEARQLSRALRRLRKRIDSIVPRRARQ